MSSYTVDTGIEVGFDAPTVVFFAQIFDAEDELVDEYESHHLAPVLEWVGHKGYLVPRDIILKLIHDSEQPWEPGPLQKALGFEARP